MLATELCSPNITLHVSDTNANIFSMGIPAVVKEVNNALNKCSASALVFSSVYRAETFHKDSFICPAFPSRIVLQFRRILLQLSFASSIVTT